MRKVDKKLIEACKNGDVLKAQNLLRKKLFLSAADCNVIDNSKGYYSETPLMATKSIEIVKMLVSQGADVNKKVIFYERGRKFEENALYSHCWSKNIEIVEFLTKNGADVNSPITRFDKEYNLLSLFVADDNADQNNFEIVKILINNGANINAKNDKGLTPLDLLQEDGIHQLRKVTEQIRLFLIQNGAECNPVSKEKYEKSILNDKLFKACENDKLDDVKELISKGANINAQPFGKTPLITASENGFYDIVEILIDNGADIHLKDFKGDTPLNWAVSWGRTKIVNFLIQKGAIVNTFNNAGHTPLIQAVDEGYVEIVKLLIDNGANVNAQNGYGDTAIIKAAYHKNIPLVQLLLDKGADPRIKNANGVSALDFRM